MRVSIRYQVVALVAASVTVTMVAFLALAGSLFTRDRLAWLYDYNALFASTLSEEVRTHLSALSDKLSYFGAEQAQARSSSDEEARRRAKTLFDASDDVLALEVWTRAADGSFERRHELVAETRLEALAIPRDDLMLAMRQSPPVVDAVLADETWVENVSLPPDIPLIRVSAATADHQVIAVAWVRPERLLRLFARSDLHRAWLSDGRGRVVVHPDPEKVLSRADLSDLSIVRTAMDAAVGLGASEFLHGGEPHIGAWASVGLGRLFVVVEVPRKEALRASDELNRRSLLFAVAVIALVLLASIFFSRRLTAPLRRLEETMRAVTRGELGAEVKVTSRNELGRLARVFNKMSRELSRREALLMERNAQLVQSEKLSALGELSAGLAHEVKNPMVGIVGFAQLGQTATSLTEAKEYFQLIERDADRANGILQNLLEFARPQQTEFKRLDAAAIVEGAARLVLHQLQIQGVQLDVSCAPGLPPIRGNANQLQQVLVNLLMNAAWAVADCPIRRVTLRAARWDDGGVFIEVSDTGQGIPPEVKARLFQPFFTTKPRGKGTGLGLSVSKSIITEHGGEIRVESTAGTGTTFYIRLPPDVGADPAPAVA